MEQGVGQRSTDALVEEDEHEGGFDPLIDEAVGVASSDAFDPTWATSSRAGSDRPRRLSENLVGALDRLR